MKKRLIIILFVFFLFMIIGYLCAKRFYISDEFYILSFQEFAMKKEDRDHLLTFGRYLDADYYVVFVLKDGNEVYRLKTDQNQVYLDGFSLNEGESVTFVVEAYQKNRVVAISQMEYVGLVHPIRVYLSPSNQTDNFGVQRAGYTTEGEMMNLVGNVVEKVLWEAGIVVFRNEPTMDLEEIVNESMELNVDLHIALHTNALGYGEENYVRGIETWVYSNESEIYPAAVKLHSDVLTIYSNVYGDRGVRLGLDEDYIIREINPEKVRHGVLMELGFHDNYEDALWVVQNVSLLGETIGKSIVEYFYSDGV